MSLLKWAGAKRWHVPQLKTLWHGERIVELFCGSAAVTLGLNPGQAVLNDANPHLINFWRWVQQGLSLDDLELTRSESLYYDYRTMFNSLIRQGKGDSLQAAQLFYYLNHQGFNGLCRFNRSGEFNVPPRPSHRAGGGLRPGERQCDVFDAALWSARLAPYTFSNEDFRDVMLEPDDFVYADPPYDAVFTDYTGTEWTREDSAEVAVTLIGHPGRVVLMNSATPWIMELYKELGYHLTLLDSKQKMQRSQGRGDVIQEVMATNFPLTTQGELCDG